MDEYAKLLTLQQSLEKESNGRRSWSGLSVNETLRQCVMTGMTERAEKVRNDFKVPDKRFVLSHFANEPLLMRI